MRLSVLFIIPFFFGCISVHVQKLPAYDAARRLPAHDRPKLFYAEDVDWSKMPAFAPFALISAGSTSIIPNRESFARSAWSEATKLGADVIVISDEDSQIAGYMMYYWGYGITSFHPVERRYVVGTCLKLQPARLGIRQDRTGMILSVDPKTKECGILEGDTLLLIDDVPVTNGAQDLKNYCCKLLTLQPEQSVSLVWLRPGLGRMEGKVKALANPPAHVNVPDSIPWNPPQQPPEADVIR